MSHLGQLLSDLNLCLNHVALYFEIPSNLPLILAQIRSHAEFDAIEEQAQMTVPQHTNTFITGTEPNMTTEPPNEIDKTGQYRCNQSSCLTRRPYEILGHFRNHMIKKHGLTKKQANALISQITNIPEGVAMVNDPVRFANTPISPDTLTTATNFSRASHDSNSTLTASPMQLTMSHPHHHHGDAGHVLMHGSVPTQSNFGLQHPQYHTNTGINDTAQDYTYPKIVANPNQPEYQYNDGHTNASTNRSGSAYSQPPKNDETTHWSH